MINQLPIILADEPTGNLDSHKGQEVMMILHDIARDDGCAILMVTHDPRVEDPVCGMRVDEWTATIITEYKNQQYVFCSQRCMDRFNNEPGKYLVGHVRNN